VLYIALMEEKCFLAIEHACLYVKGSK